MRFDGVQRLRLGVPVVFVSTFNDPNLEELATFGLVRKVLAKGALAAVEDMLKEDRKVFRERAAGFVGGKESATRVYHRFIRERYMSKVR